MKINFEGREWEFDGDDIDVRQAMVLHMTYGMTLSAWSDGMTGVDQRAYHFAYWLMLQQNGVIKPIGECNPKIIAFALAYTEAVTAEDDAAEPDPTMPLPPPGQPDGETESREPASQTTTTRPRRARQPAATG